MGSHPGSGRTDALQAIGGDPEPRSPDRGGSLQRRVERRVLGDILSGRLADMAPVSVSRLAAETGISRTPVREAMLQLERDGFLTLEENRGFFVRELTETEARELYPILHTLEDLALASVGRPPATLLRKLTELNDELAEARDPEEAIETNFAWHRLLTSSCANQELRRLLSRYRMRVYRYERAYYAPGAARLEYSLKLHREILDALGAGDVARARRILEKHWVGDYSLYLPDTEA